MRIKVRTADEVAQASAVLAAANRQRLEERQREAWQWRDVLREIEARRRQVDDELSRGTRNDPWRGAVPEPEEPDFAPVKLRGKRFDPAAAWWRWDEQGREIRVQTTDRSVAALIEVPAASVIATPDPPATNVPGLGAQLDGPIWYQALPAGKGRMVLLFYIQAISGQVQTTGSLQSVTTPRAPVAEALAQLYVDDYMANLVPGAGTGRRVKTSACFTETTIDNSVATISGVSYSVALKAVVITRSAINVVDAPSALVERIRQKFYYLNSASAKTINANRQRGVRQVAIVEQYDLSTGQSVGAGVGDGFGRFEYRETNGPVEPDEFLGGFLLTSNTFVPYSLQSDVLDLQFANPSNYQNDPATWLVLLRSYGYGKLVDRSDEGQQDPAWGWTPAVFSFLKNYDGEFHGGAAAADVAVAYDYDYIASAYLNGEPPAIMLEADYSTSSLQSGRYHWFRSPSGGNYKNPTAFASAAVRPKKVGGPQVLRAVPVSSAEQQDYQIDQQYPDFGARLGEYPWRNGAEVPVVTWDWGRGMACIGELIDLGFTPQMLLLSEQETAALATSDRFGF